MAWHVGSTAEGKARPKAKKIKEIAKCKVKNKGMVKSKAKGMEKNNGMT